MRPAVTGQTSSRIAFGQLDERAHVLGDLRRPPFGGATPRAQQACSAWPSSSSGSAASSSSRRQASATSPEDVSASTSMK